MEDKYIKEGLQAIEYAGKQKSEEAHRELFVSHVRGLVEYWFNESRQPETKSKLEGLAFSILSAIDGCSVGLPPYKLVPMVSVNDGEDWASSDIDIAGGLHETF